MSLFKKKIGIFVALCMCSFAPVFSQGTGTIPNSFLIQGNVDAQKMAFYIKSIEAADFETYRLKDENVILEFKNGFKLELISARDLTIKNKMQNVNPNNYSERKQVKAENYPVFEITSSGWIVGEVDLKNKK